MSTVQLYGSKLAARWSIQPRQGLRPSALWSRVSSDRVDLMGKYVRVPAIRVSNISGGKYSVSLCHKGSSSSSIDADTSMRHTQSKPDEAPTVEPVNGKMSMDIHVQTEAVNTIKRSAKIHDFCLGIPFGMPIKPFSWKCRFLFAGGLLGYIFSRNPTGMVSGGVILALSFFSLKVWRTGRSSLPFISDQAATSATLCLEFSADVLLVK
ncbi:protein FATTY ACID EXPORT 1, chloroplastic-like isoform X1 [Musa acuminata AAA Group]|uniref:protein FATTY ACID EXPORT 1, chloroplastic-like isoform X1 n=2 Tax=Musa acuminata AAA Group TaxID=214697 RepID=UPI0031DCA05F